MVLGPNGLILRARQARIEYTNAQTDEVAQIDNATEYIDEMVGGFNTASDFITEWTVNDNQVFALPISITDEGNDFEVNWGDGSPTEHITGELASLPTHTYETAGTYQLRIRGKCPYFCMHYLEDNYSEQMNQLTRLVNWGEIEAEAYEFAGATYLAGSIPSPQTNTFENYDETVEYLFSDTSITSIPANLFSDLPDTVVHFNNVFYGTEITSIPENLFANCTNAISFCKTFKHCDNLTAVPENLFANCTEATDFTETFDDSGLTSIPAGLFANNTKATTFESTFEDLREIESVPETLFDACVNATNFRYTFYNDGNLKTGPRLWEKTIPAGIDGTGCYGECESLEMTGMSAVWTQEKTE